MLDRDGPDPIRAGELSRAARSFLRTEAGSAVLLLSAAVLALLWANLDGGAYERFWHTAMSISVGGDTLTQDLRHWINDGLMVLFFSASGWRSPGRP